MYRKLAVLFVFLVIFVLGTTVLAQDQAPSGSLSIGVWGSRQDVESVEAVIDAYREAFPEVSLDVQATGCGPEIAECRTNIASGTMFDVVIPGSWQIQAMIEEGILLNLDPYIEQSGLNLDDFFQPAVGALTGFSDGHVYALPMGYHVEVMYYNRDLFDEAGLEYPPADGSYTWDDVREWAKALTVDAEGRRGNEEGFDPERIVQWGFRTWPGVLAGYEPILLAFGGSTMSVPTGEECNVESPESIAAHQFIQDMMWVDRSAVTPQVEQENAGGNRFAVDEIGMITGAHWLVGIINDLNPELNYNVAPLPAGPAGNASVLHVHGWGIFSGSQNPDLAWHFIQWVSTEGAGPEMGLIPAYRDLAFSDVFLEAPNEPEDLEAAFLTPLEWELTMGPTAFGPHFGQIVGPDGIGPSIEAIILNQAPAADALAGACDRVNAIINAE